MFRPSVVSNAVVTVSLSLLSGFEVYGAGQITSELSPRGILGSPFDYQITASNQPTTFDATSLPPGLSLNQATGLISGVPTIDGPNSLQLIAHGPAGDAVATAVFSVDLPIPPDDPLAGAVGVVGTKMIADPNRSRIYCGSDDQELVVVDSDTRSIVTTFPSTGYPRPAHIL